MLRKVIRRLSSLLRGGPQPALGRARSTATPSEPRWHPDHDAWRADDELLEPPERRPSGPAAPGEPRWNPACDAWRTGEDEES